MKLISHRGDQCHGENTLAAIKSALTSGVVDLVEIDLRLSSDGHWVLHHDQTIQIPTTSKCDHGNHYFVKCLSLAKLKDIGKIIALDDVLKLYRLGNASKLPGLYLDIKETYLTALVRNKLKNLVGRLHAVPQVLFGSFNKAILHYLNSLRRGNGGKFQIGYLTCNDLSSVPRELLGYIDFVSVSADNVTPADFTQFKQQGFGRNIEVYLYGLNNMPLLQKYIAAYQPNGVLSDYVYLFKMIKSQ